MILLYFLFYSKAKIVNIMMMLFDRFPKDLIWESLLHLSVDELQKHPQFYQWKDDLEFKKYYLINHSEQPKKARIHYIPFNIIKQVCQTDDVAEDDVEEEFEKYWTAELESQIEDEDKFYIYREFTTQTYHYKKKYINILYGGYKNKYKDVSCEAMFNIEKDSYQEMLNELIQFIVDYLAFKTSVSNGDILSLDFTNQGYDYCCNGIGTSAVPLAFLRIFEQNNISIHCSTIKDLGGKHVSQSVPVMFTDLPIDYYSNLFIQSPDKTVTDDDNDDINSLSRFIDLSQHREEIERNFITAADVYDELSKPTDNRDVHITSFTLDGKKLKCLQTKMIGVSGGDDEKYNQLKNIILENISHLNTLFVIQNPLSNHKYALHIMLNDDQDAMTF